MCCVAGDFRWIWGDRQGCNYGQFLLLFFRELFLPDPQASAKVDAADMCPTRLTIAPHIMWGNTPSDKNGVQRDTLFDCGANIRRGLNTVFHVVLDHFWEFLIGIADSCPHSWHAILYEQECEKER